MRIGVDVDGVIGNFDGHAKYLLGKQFNLEFGESLTWDWIPDHCTPDQWAWLWREPAVSECFGGMPVYPRSCKALEQLKDAGHEVVLITSCPPQARGARIEWLRRKDVWHESLHFTAGNKKHIVECDAYIDDNVDNLEGILHYRPEAMLFLPNRPYNQGDYPFLTRVEEVGGAVEVILKG